MKVKVMKNDSRKSSIINQNQHEKKGATKHGDLSQSNFIMIIKTYN